MQIPCVYLPGPAPAVSVANTYFFVASRLNFAVNQDFVSVNHDCINHIISARTCGDSDYLKAFKKCFFLRSFSMDLPCLSFCVNIQL